MSQQQIQTCQEIGNCPEKYTFSHKFLPQFIITFSKPITLFWWGSCLICDVIIKEEP